METLEVRKRIIAEDSETLDSAQEFINLLFINLVDLQQSFVYLIKYDDLQMSMKELINRIGTERNICFRFADVLNYPIKKDKSVAYYRNLQPFYIGFIKEKSRVYAEFSIQVKNLTGKTIPLSVNSLTIVAQVKELIQEKERIPPDQQKIYYAGCELDDDTILDDEGIKDGTIMHVILRLRGGGGGGVAFVDITNEKEAVVRQWSLKAPKWRTVTSYGLCIEGMCMNHECKTFANYVIISKGIGCYDVIYDQNDNKCPVCNQRVKPEKCAFTNCSYKYVGTKLEPGKPPQKVISDKEIEVGDHYKVFDPELAGEAKWTSLKIVTKSTEFYVNPANSEASQIEKCGVCRKPIESSKEKLDCGHRFHDECSQKMKDLNIKCPICHL